MLVDVHCHLDAYRDAAAVCRQSQEAGVGLIVAAGTGEASNARLLALRARYPEQVQVALGLHPERPDLDAAEVEAVLAQLHRHRAQVVAVGEIGLPHYALREGRLSPAQARAREALLHTLVRTAAALALPVVLHAPHETAATALAIVAHYRPPGALFHWHKAPPEVTAAICEAGYFVSVTPEVCYRARDRELVQAVPLSQLLLESDGPWPYGGEFGGQPGTPALVARVAEEVARLKGVSFEEVCRHTTANACRLFQLPSAGA